MYLTPKERISGLNAIIYRRKSQEDKRRQILSLSTQEDICIELREAWGLKVIDNYHESKSAKEPDRREKFTLMMKRIIRGEVSVIVCWKIDRLVRNMKEGGWLIDLLQNGKLKAIVTKDKAYLPEDNTIITAIEMAAATEYSRELSNKVNEGNAKKARKGMPNAHAILGYLNNTHKEQGDRDWRDDPERWGIMKQALRKIIHHGIVPNQVFLWLRDDMRLTTPKKKKIGGRLISKSAFYRFLKHSEIAGFFMYKGKKYTINGCITPMITEEEYWQLQIRLGRHGNERNRKQLSTYSGYIFSPTGDICTPDSVERVTCDCKHKFSIKTKTVCSKCNTDVSDMENPIFFSAKYYYNSRLKNARMKTKGINEKVLDKAIVNFAKSIIFTPELAEMSKQLLSIMNGKELNKEKEHQDIQRAYTQKLEARKSRAKEAYLEGIFTKEEYEGELEKLKHEEMRQKSQPKVIDWHTLADSLTTLGNDILYIWENGSIQDKRGLLEKLQSNLCWDEEKHSIIKAKWLEPLVSGLPKLRDDFSLVEPVKSIVKQDSDGMFDNCCPSLWAMWEDIRTRIIESFRNPIATRPLQYIPPRLQNGQ